MKKLGNGVHAITEGDLGKLRRYVIVLESANFKNFCTIVEINKQTDEFPECGGEDDK